MFYVHIFLKTQTERSLYLLTTFIGLVFKEWPPCHELNIVTSLAITLKEMLLFLTKWDTVEMNENIKIKLNCYITYSYTVLYLF